MTTPEPMARQEARSAAARSSPRVVTISSPGPMLGAILTLILGAALGIANQSSPQTPMSLRVPALLAALLMVAQGVVDIKRHWPQKRIQGGGDVLLDPTGAATSGSRELAVVHQIQSPTSQPATPVTVRPTPANLFVPLLVMLLAAWLGIADLTTRPAPAPLSALSLIASFALFALGWTLLPARR